MYVAVQGLIWALILVSSYAENHGHIARSSPQNLIWRPRTKLEPEMLRIVATEATEADGAEALIAYSDRSGWAMPSPKASRLLHILTCYVLDTVVITKVVITILAVSVNNMSLAPILVLFAILISCMCGSQTPGCVLTQLTFVGRDSHQPIGLIRMIVLYATQALISSLFGIDFIGLFLLLLTGSSLAELLVSARVVHTPLVVRSGSQLTSEDIERVDPAGLTFMEEGFMKKVFDNAIAAHQKDPVERDSWKAFRAAFFEARRAG